MPQNENVLFEVKTIYHVQIKNNASWRMHENVCATDRAIIDYGLVLDGWGGYQIIFRIVSKKIIKRSTIQTYSLLFCSIA